MPADVQRTSDTKQTTPVHKVVNSPNLLHHALYEKLGNRELGNQKRQVHTATVWHDPSSVASLRR